MFDYRRTHTCGQLAGKDVGRSVTLSGWVHRRRDHGGLIFIDLRDRYGLTQLILDPKEHKEADRLRQEWVLSVQGTVIARSEGMQNPKMATGQIEVKVGQLEVLSKAKTPPFSVADDQLSVSDDLRLKYRYLDIRRGVIAQNLLLRHRAMVAVRSFLDKEGFCEIVTPMLGKSTPEGSRDYLVPSRIHPGAFYALPQSPQLYKQLLMVSGMDKYFQLATCLRDEDLRADRQPEFAQIDLEMSFVTPEEIFQVVENLMAHLFSTCVGKKVELPFRRMTHKECLEQYGTDKPDLRFGMSLHRFDDCTEVPFFKDVGAVKGFCIKGGSDLSRKQLDEYAALATQLGVTTLYWTKCLEGGLATGIAKFFDAAKQKQIIERCRMEEGDLLVLAADKESKVNMALDQIRRRVAAARGLIDPELLAFLWVTDFPLFKWNEETNCLESEHHPFTSPLLSDLHLVEQDPLKVRASCYDLVLNGYEMASGSQRIHDCDLQTKIFELLKLSEETIVKRFGFFIEALRYGTPPHAGVALGFDRLIMVMAKTDNIREVVAFPKTQKATDLMTEAPTQVDLNQLKEIHIAIQGV